MHSLKAQQQGPIETALSMPMPTFVAHTMANPNLEESRENPSK